MCILKSRDDVKGIADMEIKIKKDTYKIPATNLYVINTLGNATIALFSI